jgi:predicted dehydrogenase
VRGGPGLSVASAEVSRMPSEHPEGYVEGFANLYRDAIDQILMRRDGARPVSRSLHVPTVEDGLAGMRFIEASVNSSLAGSAWTRLLA